MKCYLIISYFLAAVRINDGGLTLQLPVGVAPLLAFAVGGLLDRHAFKEVRVLDKVEMTHNQIGSYSGKTIFDIQLPLSDLRGK